MREIVFYGVALGAIVIERRRGKVSSIKVGKVDRNPPEGALWTLQFKPTREITDPSVVRILSERLRKARQYYLDAGSTFEALGFFDQMIAAEG